MFGALTGSSASEQGPMRAASARMASAREEMRRVTVDPAKLDGMITAVGYRYTNRPPWPEGNCLTFESKTNVVSGLPAGHWGLVNMHAENFHELVKRRGFKSLEFEIEGWEWEEIKTRRGEEAQWYGKKLLTHIRHLDELPPGNWRFFKKTYEIPGKEKGREIKHWFQFLVEGTGEFYLDDVSMKKL